jgi:hypothetical protein
MFVLLSRSIARWIRSNCDTDMRGWSLRVKRFAFPQTIEPIRSLGDLRRVTDSELLREPNTGLGELRRFCPHAMLAMVEEVSRAGRALDQVAGPR